MSKKLQPGEILKVVCDNGIFYADKRYLYRFFKDDEEKEIIIPRNSLVMLLERTKLKDLTEEVALLWEDRKVYCLVPTKYFSTWFKRVEMPK